MIQTLPKLEAEARVIRVNAMVEARAFAVRARAFRARQAAEEILARRRQAAREAAQLEERKRRLDEANRLKQEREEAARLERAERERWQNVQSVDLELVAPHGLWAAGEDLLVDLLRNKGSDGRKGYGAWALATLASVDSEDRCRARSSGSNARA